MLRDLNNLMIDARRLDDLPTEQIPALLTELAAASLQLAARLLAGSNGVEAQADTAKLLTVAEAAERTGMSRDYLYRHADNLPFAVRVGRSLRFSQAGLEKWIRSRSGR